MRPDIQQLITTLRRGKGSHVPNVELGIHTVIKERFLGRPVVTLADDVEFWHRAGYDYIKLQPGVDFNPGKVGGDVNLMSLRTAGRAQVGSRGDRTDTLDGGPPAVRSSTYFGHLL